MKTPFLLLSSIAVISMLTVSIGWSHGVDGYVEPIEAHCVTAMYDDGEPMSYAAVEIKAPNSEIAFQTGRTDRNGCFMIKTDNPGDWQVVVSDGTGHRLALDFSVSADKENLQAVEKVSSPRAIHHAMERPIKIIAGLSIIFGLCGIVYGWKARRNVL